MGTSFADSLGTAGGLAYYSANDGSSGLEPFVTDGTASGTRLLKDIAPGLDLRIDFEATFDGLLFKHWSVLLFVTAGSLLTAFTDSRMTAIAALGVVGIGVALLFILFSAPDVAITQLLVETLVVVLVAVAMLKLPLLGQGERTFRPLHALVSVGMGVMVTMVLISVLQGDLDRTITSYFEIASVPDANGRNIVNVVLVDFRALDTFGEVAVVLVAALAAYALLRGTHYLNRGGDRADSKKQHEGENTAEEARAR